MKPNETVAVVAVLIAAALFPARVYADQLIADDLIVKGSTCVGLDCAVGENFGSDTIRIKENNTRIRFEDVSTDSGFPKNDWLLRANETGQNGAEEFAIDDVDGGKTPFAIEAGARDNALFVEKSGEIGVGTDTPDQLLHLSAADTPALRLEQDGSGYPRTVWDVAGNESNFFIRDITTGEKLCLRIQPGAPSNSLFIASDGDVGLGTAEPDALLDIEQAGTATLRLTDTSTQDATFDLIVGDIDGGGAGFRVRKASDADVSIDLAADGSVGFGGPEGLLWNARTRDLEVQRGIVLARNFAGSSSRKVKQSLAPVDPIAILDKVATMPVAEWSYTREGDGVRHIGPMAEDFHAAFGLGDDAEHISMLDASGVAIAAIQGLHAELAAKEERIAELERRNAELARQMQVRSEEIDARLAALERTRVVGEPTSCAARGSDDRGM